MVLGAHGASYLLKIILIPSVLLSPWKQTEIIVFSMLPQSKGQGISVMQENMKVLRGAYRIILLLCLSFFSPVLGEKR
jgi:hypothetical protein